LDWFVIWSIVANISYTLSLCLLVEATVCTAVLFFQDFMDTVFSYFLFMILVFLYIFRHKDLLDLRINPEMCLFLFVSNFVDNCFYFLRYIQY